MPKSPVGKTVQLIGSKQKLLILRDLLTGAKRYNEFKRSLMGIFQKVLKASLKSMVEDGFVIRTSYPKVSPKVEYSLSPLGETMRPVIFAMEQWGKEYKKGINC